ncbi:hypothetical protein AAE478_009196 [Parahypoxylon ruwenzoriense]
MWNTVMGVFLPGPVPGAGIYAYDYRSRDPHYSPNMILATTGSHNVDNSPDNSPDNGDAGKSDSRPIKRFEILDYEHGEDFHTLGMAYDEKTSTLFVVNHRRNGPTIEMFTLDTDAFTAKHTRTIRHSLLHAPNSVALLDSHELLVTNDHYFLVKQWPLLAHMETYLSLPFGSVVHVDISSLLEDPSNAVKAHVIARVPFANGIEFLNETTVAVATTSRASVYLYTITNNPSTSRKSSPPTLTYKSMIKFPFMVDNLQVSQDGTLFAAGHPHPPTLGKFAQTRHICNSPDHLAVADAALREYCETAGAPSWASKWTEARGVEDLYVGTEYPSTCTAAFDSERKVGIFTGLYAKGIMVWRE